MALVWIFYMKGNVSTTPNSSAPVVSEKNDKFIPELNNTLETSVTVIAPTTPPAGNQ